MNFTLQCFVICAFLCATALARPQQINWNDFFAPTPRPLQQQRQPPGRPGSPTQQPVVDVGSTTSVAVPGTTQSPQYLACVGACPTTMEYNPVCGSDGEDYHNNARLQCAVRCGLNVSLVRLGACNPL